MSEPGSMTTPQPTTHRQPLCKIPEGIVCSTYFSRPTTTVCPALLPPEKRTTTFTWGVITSTTLPLPSSPHCAPITTMFGMAALLIRRGLRPLRAPPVHLDEVPLRMVQHVAHRQRALAAAHQVHRQQLLGARAGAAHHEHVAHPLGARVGDRLVQPPADDVARHRDPAVAQAARQRER